MTNQTPPEPSTTAADEDTPLDERFFRAGVKEGRRLGEQLANEEAAMCDSIVIKKDAEITRLEEQLVEVRQINANQIERIVEMRNQRHEVEEKLAESERLRLVYEDTAEKLAEKVVRYQEALEYYADENNYDRWVQEDDKADGSPSCCSEIDDGRRAREALASPSPNHGEEAGIGEGEK